MSPKASADITWHMAYAMQSVGVFKFQAAKPQIHYGFEVFVLFCFCFWVEGVIAYSETLYCCHFVKGNFHVQCCEPRCKKMYVRRHMAERSAILNLL